MLEYGSSSLLKILNKLSTKQKCSSGHGCTTIVFEINQQTLKMVCSRSVEKVMAIKLYFACANALHFMSFKITPICFVLIMLLSAGCSRRSLNYLSENGVSITASASMTSAATGMDSIQLQYLGCGGFFIRQSGIAIMIDPFFSHQSFMRIGRSILTGGKIRPMRKQLAYGKRMILDSLDLTAQMLHTEVKGVFSAHGHYDHLMDVPLIHHEWLNQNADVFANTSSTVVTQNVIRAGKLHDIEKIASVRDQKGDSIVFSNGRSGIRVYPIFADHNPHSRNIKLFSGSAVRSPKHFNKYDDKTSVNDWLEGQTLSFLIDFVKNDTIQFRIFLQSSTCQFPNGIPPHELLNEKKIDLAIMGVASYHFAENSYPCEFLSRLQPRKLMFIHWEDFFRRYDQKLKAVKINDIPRFFNEVFSECKMEYEMPVPGSVITITH
jgi:hypothetical protein